MDEYVFFSHRKELNLVVTVENNIRKVGLVRSCWNFHEMKKALKEV